MQFQALPGPRVRRLALCGCLAITAAGMLPWRVAVARGRSMEPTLHSGQPFAWQRWDPSREPLRRGEVVILRVNRVLCVKRILALGGDAFWALNRRSESLASALLLPVNTSPRPWTRRFHNLQARRVRIPAGQLFVVGDGTVSCDSRHYGPVPQTEVIGRVLLPGSDPEEGLRQVTWSRPPRRPGEPRG